MTDPIATLDFAALRVLKLVHELRSFTGAAAHLQINQSAVSYTVDKLRRAFDDPLFYRHGGRVIPTERCDALVTQAAALLDGIERMIEPRDFDPAEARDSVTIACNYYERQLVLPGVLRSLRREAPGLRLRLVQSTHQGPELLKRGEADLAMGPVLPVTNDYYCRTILEERYVCVMDTANPLATGALNRDTYLGCDHVTVTYGQDWRSGYLRALEDEGHRLNTVLEVPSPAGLDKLIAGTDLISTLPARLADSMGPGIAQLPCPYPAPFRIALVWTTRTHGSPMHVWLRQRITDSIRLTRRGDSPP